MLKPNRDFITAGQLLILALIMTMTNTMRAEAASSVRVEPAQIVVVDPFQIELSGKLGPGEEANNFNFTVPPGKTLVIEYASGDCVVPTGQICLISVETEGATSLIEFQLHTDLLPNFLRGQDRWRAGQQVLLYTTKGGALRVERNSPDGTATFVQMSLSGHLQ